MKTESEQELFWKGSFGDEYTDRNQGRQWIASNLSLFSCILRKTQRVSSIIELGANVGLNLDALHQLVPCAQVTAIEINEKAVKLLRQKEFINVIHGSILDYNPATTCFDFAFSKGVLIHLNPDLLPLAYDALYKSSSRYICIAEYYNPVPIEVSYRGNSGKLFKRDFCGELMDRFNDLELLDYGFVYHRDVNFPEDDLNWFLLEKKQLR